MNPQTQKPAGIVDPDPVPVVRPRQTTPWSTDTFISQPLPASKEMPVLVSFGGFGFTSGGIAHDVTEAQVEEIFTPMFAPEGFNYGR